MELRDHPLHRRHVARDRPPRHWRLRRHGKGRHGHPVHHGVLPRLGLRFGRHHGDRRLEHRAPADHAREALPVELRGRTLHRLHELHLHPRGHRHARRERRRGPSARRPRDRPRPDAHPAVGGPLVRRRGQRHRPPPRGRQRLRPRRQPHGAGLVEPSAHPRRRPDQHPVDARLRQRRLDRMGRKGQGWRHRHARHARRGRPDALRPLRLRQLGRRPYGLQHHRERRQALHRAVRRLHRGRLHQPRHVQLDPDKGRHRRARQGRAGRAGRAERPPDGHRGADAAARHGRLDQAHGPPLAGRRGGRRRGDGVPVRLGNLRRRRPLRHQERQDSPSRCAPRTAPTGSPAPTAPPPATSTCAARPTRPTTSTA